jgi:outer membrane lipoprotein SlyB
MLATSPDRHAGGLPSQEEKTMRAMMLKSGLVLSLSVLLAACASQPRHGDVRYSGARCDTCGTVQSIEWVWVRDRPGGGGAVLGAIIGGVVGSNIGSGSGRRAATVGGAAAGAVIGHEVERSRTGERRGYLFEVRLDDGRWAEVTQLENPGLRVGDRVIIRNQQVHPLRR